MASYITPGGHYYDLSVFWHHAVRNIGRHVPYFLLNILKDLVEFGLVNVAIGRDYDVIKQNTGFGLYAKKRSKNLHFLPPLDAQRYHRTHTIHSTRLLPKIW